MQEAAGISALVFAAAGMGGAAVGTSMNSDAAEDVNLYSFELNGVKYAGCTRKATFQNGDQVELVFEPKAKGNEVLAVRRPATRSIWLYPFMSRGTVAGKFFAVTMLFQFGFWFAVFFSVICIFSLLLSDGAFDWKLLGILLIANFLSAPLIIALGASWMLPRFYRFTEAANEVFAALGYKEHAKVDLHKTSKAHRKAKNIIWTADNNHELWY